MSLEFSHYPLAPFHHLHSGLCTLRQTVHLMKVCEFTAQRPGEACTKYFCHRRSLINLQVVSLQLSAMIIVTARRARSSHACLTSLTPPELPARLNDKVVPAKPSWFRAPRKIATYFSILRCSLKCNIINFSSTFFFFSLLGDLRL